MPVSAIPFGICSRQNLCSGRLATSPATLRVCRLGCGCHNPTRPSQVVRTTLPVFLRSSIYAWASPAARAGSSCPHGGAPTLRRRPRAGLHPVRDHVGLVPHVTEIHAEDRFVRVHQRDRMEKRHAERDRHQPQRPEQPGCRRGRDAEHSEPSRRAQRPVALLPVIAAERIDDERHAASRRSAGRVRSPSPSSGSRWPRAGRARMRNACLPLLAVP